MLEGTKFKVLEYNIHHIENRKHKTYHTRVATITLSSKIMLIVL